MKTYDKYKSSGIDWIGDIPEHWEFKSLRRITEEHRQGYYTTKEYLTEGVKLIRITDLDENGKISYETMPFVEISEKDEEIFQVQYGDFLFPRTGSIGLLGLVNNLERAVFASYLINFRFKKHLSPNFLKFYFFSDAFKTGIIRDLHGGVNQNIHAENIKNQFIAIPTFSEQTAIADYLDEKTAQTDKLIAEKRRLIELLKEERLGVINQAVTRGINPHAKLKTSGIAWLGDIPEHWEIKRLKYVVLVKARLGWKGLKASEYVLEGFGFLSTPNIKPKEIDFENINYITEERYIESPEIMLEVGDVLLAKDGSTLGTINVVKDLPFPSTVNSSIAVLRITDKNAIIPLFLKRFIESDFTQNVIEMIKDGMGVPHLFQADIKEFELLLPPIEEQKQIVEFIETATGKINATIATIEKEIGFLREYRTALISEVVTGKIKVIQFN